MENCRKLSVEWPNISVGRLQVRSKLPLAETSARIPHPSYLGRCLVYMVPYYIQLALYKHYSWPLGWCVSPKVRSCKCIFLLIGFSSSNQRSVGTKLRGDLARSKRNLTNLVSSCASRSFPAPIRGNARLRVFGAKRGARATKCYYRR